MCLAIPGKILHLEGDSPLTRSGEVSFGGIKKKINLAYVPEAKVMDYVIVHAGFAISILNETEAQRVFDYLAPLNSSIREPELIEKGNS